ncbi:MAG: hypothetical protein QM484_04425, partial [Woeseiaceae bacterium]
MTLLVAINLGDYAIIAADKKEVVIFDDCILPVHESANKVVDVGIGLMTGSGYVKLLESVKTAIKEQNIDNTGN